MKGQTVQKLAGVIKELFCFEANLVLDIEPRKCKKQIDLGTGKSVSEALILASTNPQYNKRLFIENKNKKTICVHNMF